MAVRLSPSASTSCRLNARKLGSQPSLSVATKVFVGLKPQSLTAYVNQKPPNLSAEFHARVYKSVHTRPREGKPVQGRVSMMPIGVPQVPYRVPGENTWQWVDLWNALYRERIIFLGQHIDEEFSNQILGTMLYLDTLDTSRRMFLFISCPGGDVTPSLALYDTMKSIKNPVGTHCVGYAYDLSAFILSAGDKGYRTATKMSRIALQPPAGAARGRADDVRNEANELLRIRDYLYKELSKNTGQPLEKIMYDLKWIKRFSAQQAIEYGVIDRIVKPKRVKATAPPLENSVPFTLTR